MADIDLTIDLKPGNVKQTAERLQGDIEQVFDSKVEERAKLAFMRLQVNMQKVYASAERILQEMTKLESVRGPSDEFVEIDEQITKTEQALIKVQDRMEKFIAIGGKTNSRAFKGMEYDAEQLKSTLEALHNDMQDLRDTGGDTRPGKDTARYKQLKDELAEINNKMRLYIEQANQMGATGVEETTRKFDRLRNVIQSVLQVFRNYSLAELSIIGLKKAVQGLTTGLGKAGKALLRLSAKGIVNGLSKGLSVAANMAQKLASNLLKAVKANTIGRFTKLGGSFTNLSDGIGKFTGGLNKGFWTVMKYAFGLRSLFIVTNKVRNALKDGIKNLVQYSSSFNRSISNMLSSLTYLKNSLATAFEPLITTVAPIITKFIDTIANALSKLSQFFSALIGRNWYYKAKKVYQDYAASIASGSDDANKKAEKLQRTISGFDDVEILHEPDDSSDSGGSGASGPTPADMFEVAPVESAIKSLADELRSYIENQDWEGLGQFLGEKINSVFQKAHDILTSQELYDKIDEVTNAITTTFNSLVDTIDWDLVGSTFAAGINVIVHAANQLLEGIDWKNLGNSIATGLNALFRDINWTELGELFANYLNALFALVGGVAEEFDWEGNAKYVSEGINAFINKVDWAQMGKTISDSVKGALTFIGTVIEEIDWKKLGESIKTAIINIDWNGIADAFFEALGAAIGGITAFIVGLLGEIPGAIKTYFSEHIQDAKDAGGNIVTGILSGIVDAIVNIGKWIKEHIFDPFIEGFKKAFGIASPAKEMEPYGKDIILGVLEGIIGALANIGKWVVDNILSPLVKGIADNLSTLGDIGKQIKDKIFEKLEESSIVSLGKDLIKNIKEGIANKLEDLKEKGEEIKEKIKNGLNKDGFAATGEGIGNKLMSGIQEKLSDLKEKGKEIKEKLKDGINKDSFLSLGESIAKKVRDGIENIKDDLKKKGQKIKSWVYDSVKSSDFAKKGASMVKNVASGIKSVKSTLTQKGKDIKKWIVDNISLSSFKYVGAGVINGIVQGIRNLMHKIKEVAGDIAENLKTKIKDILGIHSPSKVMREEVGKMIVLGLTEGINTNADKAIDAMGNISDALLNEVPTSIPLPDIVGGEVIPYDVELSSKSNLNNIMDTLKNLIEMLEYTQENQIDRDDLELMITNIVQRYMNIDFYIGDEQVARHANAGNEKLNRRFKPVMA